MIWWVKTKSSVCDGREEKEIQIDLWEVLAMLSKYLVLWTAQCRYSLEKATKVIVILRLKSQLSKDQFAQVRDDSAV